MPAQWPAIIEPELWQTSQRLLARHIGRGGRRTKGEEQPYAFRGLLRAHVARGSLLPSASASFTSARVATTRTLATSRALARMTCCRGAVLSSSSWSS